MKKRKLFYIIYSKVRKKHPDWLREDVRNATIALLSKGININKWR